MAKKHVDPVNPEHCFWLIDPDSNPDPDADLTRQKNKILQPSLKAIPYIASKICLYIVAQA